MIQIRNDEKELEITLEQYHIVASYFHSSYVTVEQVEEYKYYSTQYTKVVRELLRRVRKACHRESIVEIRAFINDIKDSLSIITEYLHNTNFNFLGIGEQIFFIKVLSDILGEYVDVIEFENKTWQRNESIAIWGLTEGFKY